MTYSFPCQDLSLAGKGKGMKKGSGTRSGLLWEVERLLTECGNNLPQILVMENVPQVISEKNKDDFQAWVSFLESKGYSNYCEVLNAKDYGIPQNRERCFMISILGETYYEFPKPIPLKLKLKDMLEKEGDGIDISGRMQYHRGTVQKGITQTLDTKCNVGCVVKNIIPYGSYWTWENKKGELNGQCYRANNENNYALAITCHHAGNVYEEETLRIRKLTPKECWRLMGFSDEDFDKASKVNSNAQLYKQAGNSIVVNVLMAIFKQLL